MNQSLNLSFTKHKKRAVAILVACGCLLVLPSCWIPGLRRPMPGPGLKESYDLRKEDPQSDLPEVFEAADSAENSARLQLEEFFSDPMLIALMYQALDGNQELRILSENVQIASNEILARQGAYLPFVTLGAAAGIDRYSSFTIPGAGILNDPFRPGLGRSGFLPNPLPNYLLGPAFFWTPDIWRQLHNAKDAAAARYYAAAEGRNYFVTGLVAEIAENYYRLMALDQRIEILDQTIAIQEQSLQVARTIKEGARGTELPVQRFLAEVRRNQSEKLIVNQDIIEAENRINFLLGRNPQRVERMKGNFLDLTLHSLSVGLPAELLENRNDIRQAERELASAGLDVLVARKRFYPQGFISSGIGYQAFDPKYLFVTPEALIVNVAGNLVTPFINRKAIKAEYFSANARQLQAVYNYQRVVLEAFIQVVNDLARVENYRNSIEVKKQQLAALEESVEVAMKLFQFARADYVDVLFAQRDLRDARTVIVETKQQQLSAVVQTYRALGGGNYLLPIPVPQPLQPHKWMFWKHAHPVAEVARGPLPPPAPSAEMSPFPPPTPTPDAVPAPPPTPSAAKDEDQDSFSTPSPDKVTIPPPTTRTDRIETSGPSASTGGLPDPLPKPIGGAGGSANNPQIPPG
ncbi:TolC family protein [Paludisphaera mucosa]|uniref:TolC family protein n=1 Tax=Paludisphaera mucosa TaxID=3030827 RepID=A0ABT6FDS7_9BACT|nr:TolC family protein [Paludisphaera mucosa]MDG3005737.1 TolC family protein [Paludisphaera mucosa]